MNTSTKLAITTMIVLLHGCGGGQSSVATAASTKQASPTPSLSMVIDYSPTVSPLFPGGTIEVSPAADQMTIGVKPIAKVELLLFGYDAQVLTAPNHQPKDNPQLRYVFTLPATFTSGSYACGTGAYISEVRVTDAAGLTLSKTFELCPGTPLTTAASAP